MSSDETSWIGNVNGVSVEDTGSVSYPALQIVNGGGNYPEWRKRGAFFVPAEIECDGSWEPCTMVTRDESEVEGYYRNAIIVTVIRARRKWTAKAGNRELSFAWKEYDKAAAYGKARGKAQVLCIVQGIAQPVAIAASGYQADHALGRKGWGNMARDYLYGPASAIASKQSGKNVRLPSLCFAISLGFGPSVKVGQGDATSFISPVKLVSPSAPVKPGDIGGYVLSRSDREIAEQLYHASAAWGAAWDKFDASARDTSDNRGGYTRASDSSDDGEEIPF